MLEEPFNLLPELGNNIPRGIECIHNKPKTNVTVEPGTFRELAKVENIVAVKDSTGGMTNSEEYIRLTRHISTVQTIRSTQRLFMSLHNVVRLTPKRLDASVWLPPLSSSTRWMIS